MGNINKQGFDSPLIDEVNIEKINEAIHRLSEMINVLLSKARSGAYIDRDGNLIINGNIKCNDLITSASSMYLKKLRTENKIRIESGNLRVGSNPVIFVSSDTPENPMLNDIWIKV